MRPVVSERGNEMLPTTGPPAALVTGGSSGIGLGVAKALAEDGYAVSLVARRKDRLEEAVAAIGESAAIAIVSDVTDSEGVAAAVAQHQAHWGRLDVLVNNAGGGIIGPMEEASLKAVDLQLDLNLRAVILFYRSALPHLLEAGAADGALVLNMASSAGKTGKPTLGVYSAAKHGVVGFSEAMNREFGDRGVKSCVFCPGYVDTPLAADTDETRPSEMIQTDDIAGMTRALLSLSRYCVIPEVLFLRPGLVD